MNAINDSRINKILRDKMYEMMSDISEEHYFASWLIGLEHSLWKAVKNLQVDWRYGIGQLDREALSDLRLLSELLDGWQTFERFVPMPEWLEMYDESEAQVYVIKKENSL